jgi:hypothetical protein
MNTLFDPRVAKHGDRVRLHNATSLYARGYREATIETVSPSGGAFTVTSDGGHTDVVAWYDIIGVCER